MKKIVLDMQSRLYATIGNLALTAYNFEMSDRPFMEKMNMEGGFKQSALRLNGYLVMQDKWNEEKSKREQSFLQKQL